MNKKERVSLPCLVCYYHLDGLARWAQASKPEQQYQGEEEKGDKRSGHGRPTVCSLPAWGIVVLLGRGWVLSFFYHYRGVWPLACRRSPDGSGLQGQRRKEMVGEK